MAVVGWLLLGAVAGVVVNQLEGEGARSLTLTVIGAMTGALIGGTVMSAAFGIAAVGSETVLALVVLAVAAAVRIALEERHVAE
jgi:hypothetical protein